MNSRKMYIISCGVIKQQNNKGAYINYVRGGPEDFTNFSKKIRSPVGRKPKYFMAQQFLENISWPLPSLLVSYLRLSCNSISG